MIQKGVKFMQIQAISNYYGRSLQNTGRTNISANRTSFRGQDEILDPVTLEWLRSAIAKEMGGQLRYVADGAMMTDEEVAAKKAASRYNNEDLRRAERSQPAPKGVPSYPFVCDWNA